MFPSSIFFVTLSFHFKNYLVLSFVFIIFQLSHPICVTFLHFSNRLPLSLYPLTSILHVVMTTFPRLSKCSQHRTCDCPTNSNITSPMFSLIFTTTALLLISLVLNSFSPALNALYFQYTSHLAIVICVLSSKSCPQLSVSAYNFLCLHATHIISFL